MSYFDRIEVSSIASTPNVNVLSMPNVVVSSMPNVVVSGTPIVTVSSIPNVTIAGTPNMVVTSIPDVVISGTPIVSVSSIPDIVVSGTPNVNVTGIPNITVSGTPLVSVTSIPDIVVSGTPIVTIESMPNVTISSTPVVSISSIPNVTIAGTPVINMSSSIPTGTNFIGRSGATAFKVSANFTRPTEATPTQYSIDDIISDSASTPTNDILPFDLTSFGAEASQFIQITNCRVISNVKGSVIDLNANVWLFPSALTHGSNNTELRDNLAFGVEDSVAVAGGVVVPCLNAYRNALNHRAVSDPSTWIMQIGSDKKIHGYLQAANAYTPQSGEIFYVILEGVLL